MSKNSNLVQQDFRGGLNAGVAANNIDDSEYAYLSNARNRGGALKAIRKAVKQTDAPPNVKFQGLQAVGDFLVLFAGGQAFYKSLVNPGDSLQPLAFFQMAADADVIYSQLIPQATLNHVRVAVDETSPNKGANLIAETTSNTPGALVVQDGVNQPRLIFSDGQTRLAKTYLQWTKDDREYIPVGKQMIFVDNILYVIAPNGKSIYRSVSGRPADFVVAITNQGEKVADATAVSHAVDYNTITAISRVSGNKDAKILVSSPFSSSLIVPTFDRSLYGEPTFLNVGLFATGALNQFSVVESLGDSILVDGKGIRSFNATQQLLVASNSDIFSEPVYPYFTDVTQDITAAISFDNYELFAVKTVFGYGVVVYDLQSRKFVSFDQYEGVGPIKQFSVTRVGINYRIFCITTENELFELFASTEVETATVYSKETSFGDSKKVVIPTLASIQFDRVVTDGVVSATVVVDRRSTFLGSRTVVGNPEVPTKPYPIENSTNDSSYPVSFDIEGAPAGNAAGVLVSWNFEGDLTSITLRTNVTDYTVPINEQARVFHTGN